MAEDPHCSLVTFATSVPNLQEWIRLERVQGLMVRCGDDKVNNRVVAEILSPKLTTNMSPQQATVVADVLDHLYTAMGISCESVEQFCARNLGSEYKKVERILSKRLYLPVAHDESDSDSGIDDATIQAANNSIREGPRGANVPDLSELRTSIDRLLAETGVQRGAFRTPRHASPRVRTEAGSANARERKIPRRDDSMAVDVSESSGLVVPGPEVPQEVAQRSSA